MMSLGREGQHRVEDGVNVQCRNCADVPHLHDWVSIVGIHRVSD
jgi:hypothetical protein